MHNAFVGRVSREKPKKLPEKLRQIREKFHLSQGGMLIRLGLQETSVNRSSISGYELGEREPPLLILYSYAKAANIYLEVLVDDEISLPDIIPSEEKSLGKKVKNMN
jgi:transcriptional regulator with XRE-family HTH domain